MIAYQRHTQQIFLLVRKMGYAHVGYAPIHCLAFSFPGFGINNISPISENDSESFINLPLSSFNDSNLHCTILSQSFYSYPLPTH